MALGDDFEIQNDKDIRYTGSTANYTVYELHVWLQGLADDASSAGDDFMDMSRPTPSEKAYYTIITLLNGYNIDNTAAQHLYNGSIIQANGDEIYDGIQVLAPPGMYLQIIQNGSLATNFWTTGLNADAANGISHQFILKVRMGGADIDGRRLIGTTREWGKTFLEFKVNGTSRGVNVMAFTSWATDLNNATASATVAGWTTIANVTAGYNGIDVNNDSTDEYYYSEWNRDTYTINQFYERMKYLVRRDSAETLYGLDGDLFRGITHEIVVDGGTGDFDPWEPVSWTGGTGQMLAIDSETAPTKMWIQLKTGVAPTDDQVISGSTGATATMNVTITDRPVSTPFCGQSTGATIIGAYGFGIEALDLSASDKVFDLTNTAYQAPNWVTFTVGGLTYPNEDYVLVGPRGYRLFYYNETAGPFTVGEKLIFTNPAGSAILADLLDLGTTGEIYTGSMLAGVAPAASAVITGSDSGASACVMGTVFDDINLRQLTLNGALTGGAVTSVVVNESIPTDTPTAKQIRIKRASGKYTRHPYSAWNGGTKTFTIASHDFSTDNAPNGGQSYISYIDNAAESAAESFQGVFSGDRPLFIRVRNGGSAPIKTFETTGMLGSAGGTATAVRTSDA